MALIGSRKHAAFIQASVKAHGSSFSHPDWNLVGSGSYRDVWLHTPTKVVYKVENNRYAEQDGYGSAREVRNARTLRKKSGGTGIIGRMRIPLTSGFRIGESMVVAMEVVQQTVANTYNKPTPASPEGRWDLYTHGRFYDMHWENYFIDEKGYVVPIDMACPRGKEGADLRVLKGTPHYDPERKRRYPNYW